MIALRMVTSWIVGGMVIGCWFLVVMSVGKRVILKQGYGQVWPNECGSKTEACESD